MPATLKIISGRVGEGGTIMGIEVQRIQQLLCRAMMLDKPAVTGSWSPATTEALHDFQRFCNIPDPLRVSYLLPSDNFDLLLKLCECAGVLLPVPSGKRRAPAFLEFFATATAKRIPYGWSGAGGADRLAFGLDGRPGHIVFTTPHTPHSEFDLGDVPIAMNCTSFTNLAMSIWRSGNAHAAPYDCSQDAGGFIGLGTRYGLSYLYNPNAPSLSPDPYSLASPLAAGRLANHSNLACSPGIGKLQYVLLSRRRRAALTKTGCARQTQLVALLSGIVLPNTPWE